MLVRVYRTDAVRSREGRCGPAGWSGGPSTVHTATATKAEVRMVQATSCLRIRPNPSVEGSAIVHCKRRRPYELVHRGLRYGDVVAKRHTG
ncbi:hypothetical protein FXB38_37120 [Bradyrhizobium cytisi]|uniref:Uncharacterized protein n=1 Tax=Bradyrhizobium cytisi TaxID=515489 RepID=A0A5S4W3H9_9BRAD|nr:hypothetical protein FXB38_37120 [Bradyrhizobium cytisi]